MGERMEQLEVLHVSGAHLDDVDFIEEGKLGDVHDFGDYRKPCLLAGLKQQLDPLFTHSLEGVGGRARLERATPQDVGARRLHSRRNGTNLLLAFHRTWPRNQGKVAAAYLDAVRKGDDRVLRMKFPVGGLVGILDALDLVDNVQGADEVDVDTRGVSNQPQNLLVLAFGCVDLKPLALQPGNQILQLHGIWIFLQYDYHGE